MMQLEQRNARGEPQRYLLALALKFLLRDPPSKSLHKTEVENDVAQKVVKQRTINNNRP